MTSLMITLTATLLTASNLPTLPSQLDLDELRTLPTQHDGRFPPLDTVARDLVWSVTGTERFNGHDPVLLLMGWTFQPERWMEAPLIHVGNDALRAALELPADREWFSYRFISSHQPLVNIITEVRQQGQGAQLDPLQKKASQIWSKLLTLDNVFAGNAIPVIPDPSSSGAPWRTIREASSQDSPRVAAMQSAWRGLGAAFNAGNPEEFKSAVSKLHSAQAALPAQYVPSSASLSRELHYNQLNAYTISWIALALGTFCGLLGSFFGRGRGLSTGAICDLLSVAGIVVGFGILTYGIWLRWGIADRTPAANMFESMLFLSWGGALFAILATFVVMFIGKGKVVPLTAAVMSSLALALADLLPMDFFVRPAAPALLDTYWMAIHVPIIMMSYALLAVSVLIAHGQLFLMSAAPHRKDLAAKLDWNHYGYAFAGSWLLLAGIFTGSMWGAEAWGRYWGWDPKEVWSLIAALCYLAILHIRIDQMRVPPWMYWFGAFLGAGLLLAAGQWYWPFSQIEWIAFGGTAAAGVFFMVGRGAFATAVKSCLAFWLIIMTYIGVNYVLGTGLHSYGFGTGPVIRWMYFLGGLDLVLIAGCGIVYVARTQVFGTAPEPEKLPDLTAPVPVESGAQ